MSPTGFAHSEIRGSEGVCPSPRLIAACHVLLRLPVPRHPPCALAIFFSDGQSHHTGPAPRGAAQAIVSDAIFLLENLAWSRYAALKVRRRDEPSKPDAATAWTASETRGKDGHRS